MSFPLVVPAFAITLYVVAGYQEHSKTAVVLLRKRSLPHPLLIHLLHCLLCGTYGFDFSGEHIEGMSNTAADAISWDNCV